MGNFNAIELVGEFGLVGCAVVALRWARPYAKQLIQSHLAFVAMAGDRLVKIEAKVDQLLEEVRHANGLE